MKIYLFKKEISKRITKFDSEIAEWLYDKKIIVNSLNEQQRKEGNFTCLKQKDV